MALRMVQVSSSLIFHSSPALTECYKHFLSLHKPYVLCLFSGKLCKCILPHLFIQLIYPNSNDLIMVEIVSMFKKTKIYETSIPATLI